MVELIDQLSNYAGGSGILDGGQERPPNASELYDKPYAAPGRPAQLRIGIVYQAPWKTAADGMGQHARQQIRALASTGLPLRIQPIGGQIILNQELDKQAQQLAYLEGVSFTHTSIAIKHFVFDTPELLREMVCPTGVRNSTPEAVKRIVGSTVVYTSWERDRVHPQFVSILKDVAQVWVPCERNRWAFVDSGLDEGKVKVIPYTYNPEEHMIAAPRGSEQVPSGKRFYHIGKWEPRKNQHQLLGAFLMAYGPRDKASLLIKTSGFGYPWANYPSPAESIQFWLTDPRVQIKGWTMQDIDRLVRIIDKKLSDEDYNLLHKQNNIYVSSGLGEAWDIPAFEAKLAGNNMVYVGYGGPCEYARKPEDVQVRIEGSQRVHSGYGWEADAQWAKVLTDDFTQALVKAVPAEERMVPPEYCSKYGHFAVANLMRQNIEQIARSLSCWELMLDAGGFG